MARIRDTRAEPDTLARAQRVDAHHRIALHQLGLRLGAPHHARRDDDQQRRQVVWLPRGGCFVECLDHRLGERIADDRDVGDPLSFDRAPQFVGIELAAVEHDRLTTDEQHLHRGHQPRAVHERRRRHDDPRPAVGVGLGGERAGLLHAAGHRESQDRVHDGRQRPEQVLVAHAGRATGVQEPEVVPRSLDPRHGLVVRDRVFVEHGAVDER